MSADRPVRVAGGRNQAEAEYIQNILREDGIASMVQRTAGFDVPEYLAAGPRDVMVMATRADEARAVLQAAGFELREANVTGPDPARLLAGVVAAVVLVALVVLAGLVLA